MYFRFNNSRFEILDANVQQYSYNIILLTEKIFLHWYFTIGFCPNYKQTAEKMNKKKLKKNKFCQRSNIISNVFWEFICYLAGILVILFCTHIFKYMHVQKNNNKPDIRPVCTWPLTSFHFTSSPIIWDENEYSLILI